MNLVYRVIPPPSEEQLLRKVRAAMEEARRFGVTSIHDISSTEDVRAYQTLADRGELTLRIYSLTPPSALASSGHGWDPRRLWQ